MIFSQKRGVNLGQFLLADDVAELKPLDSISRKTLAGSIRAAFAKLESSVDKVNDAAIIRHARDLVINVRLAVQLRDTVEQVQEDAQKPRRKQRPIVKVRQR